MSAVENGHCVVSAHTVGANSSPGVESEGNFMLSAMNDKQWISLVKLCADICELCHLKPAAIKGHRDFNATLCPGDHLYLRLPELRIAVAAQLAARKRRANSKPS